MNKQKRSSSPAPVHRLVGRHIRIKCTSCRFSLIEIAGFVEALLTGNEHALVDDWPFNGEDGKNDEVGLSFRLRKIKSGVYVVLWDTEPNIPIRGKPPLPQSGGLPPIADENRGNAGETANNEMEG